MKGSKIFH